MPRSFRYPLLSIAAWAGLAAPMALAGTVTLPDFGGPFSVSVKSYKEIRFHGVVRQQYDFSCGSAALATLLAYHYGHPATEQSVFNVMYETGDQERIRQMGFSMLDMKRYVEKKGFQANGYKVTLADIEKTKVPGIALITLQGYRHFVVVKGVNHERVLIGDPALGLRAISRSEFEAGWNGLLFAMSGGRLAPDGFNRPQEWAVLPPPPMESAVNGPASLANFTLSLPKSGDF